MSFLFAGSSDEQEPSSADMVEKFMTRLNTAVNLEDRRAAVRGLRLYSKKDKVVVGSQAIPSLVDVLKNGRADVEMCNLALETLINLTTPDKEYPEGETPPDTDVGVMFTEMFVKQSDHVLLLLALLEETDLHVRLNTVKLLTTLLNNRSKLLQESIMLEPVACARLMDLLQERRDIIRNEGLLLMIGLTRGNTQIQKIVAFQNAFEETVNIIQEEGNSEGGIIVDDCLKLLLNLVTDNTSNQSFFRESSLFPRLVPFFEQSDPTAEIWPEQRVRNAVKMLQFIRVFVSPGVPQTARSAHQSAILNSGLFKALCDFAFNSTFPQRQEVLRTVGEIMRRNDTVQQHFDQYLTPQKYPSLIALLNFAFDSSLRFEERYAAVFCFQSVLENNAALQNKIALTLLPEGAPSEGPSPGLLLCRGLLANGMTWVAASAFAHVLIGNGDVKEKVLRVALAGIQSQEPQSLLTICVNHLSSVKTSQDRNGILFLLACWLQDCPFAVNTFLQIPDVIPFLLQMMHDNNVRENPVTDGLVLCLFGVCLSSNDGTLSGFDGPALMEILTHRIGTEDFLGRLEKFANCEPVKFVLQAPYACDEQKTVFSQAVGRSLIKAIQSIKAVVEGGDEPVADARAPQRNTASVEYHDAVIQQYKDLIRSQDEELRRLRTETQQQQQQQQLTSGSANGTTAAATAAGDASEAEALRDQVEQLQATLTERDSAISELRQQLDQQQQQPSDHRGDDADDAEHLREQNTQLAQCVSDLRAQLRAAQEQAEAAGSGTNGRDADTDIEHQHQLRQQQALAEEQRQQITDLETRLAAANSRLSDADHGAQALEEKANKADARLRELHNTHQELLVVLAEEHEKLEEYRQRLLDNGIHVSDDEDDLDTTAADEYDDQEEEEEEEEGREGEEEGEEGGEEGDE